MSSRSRSKASHKSPPVSSRPDSFDHDLANSILPPPPQPSTAGLGLWRAIAGELSKLSSMQTATAETTREVINESPLSGVLAIYGVEGNRVINDYIFKTEGGEVEVSERMNELEKLRQAYEQNKERLNKEKKSLEQIIGPLKKLVGDAAAVIGKAPPIPSDRKRRFDELGTPDSSSGASTSPPNISSSGKTTNKRGKQNPASSGDATASGASAGAGTGYPILAVGSQVAFRLHKQRVDSEEEEEWIQCEVTKVFSEGARYEVRDPEPDENNNPGQSYKTTYRDLIRIPPENERNANLPPYPVGSKVLARYPETTTFYRAEVVGTKRDGKCRLKFVGEEDEGKEQEVERRVVLPIPQYSR